MNVVAGKNCPYIYGLDSSATSGLHSGRGQCSPATSKIRLVLKCLHFYWCPQQVKKYNLYVDQIPKIVSLPYRWSGVKTYYLRSSVLNKKKEVKLNLIGGCIFEPVHHTFPEAFLDLFHGRNESISKSLDAMSIT